MTMTALGTENWFQYVLVEKPEYRNVCECNICVKSVAEITTSGGVNVDSAETSVQDVSSSRTMPGPEYWFQHVFVEQPDFRNMCGDAI